MILVIPPEDRYRYRNQIHDYFRIRKTVFRDLLRWDVEADGDEEHDVYDTMACHYILSIDRDGAVQGGLRQMDMSAGPTLTMEKFGDMVDNPAKLVEPDTWETTRFAIRPDKKDIRFMSGVNRIAIELSAASLERGVHFGARRHIAVCEDRVVRLTTSFRIPCEVLGRREMPDGSDIMCVSWEVSDASVERLQWARSHFEAA